MRFCEAGAGATPWRQQHWLYLGEMKMLKGHGGVKNLPCIYLLYSVVVGLVPLLGLDGCTNKNDPGSAGATSYHSYNHMTGVLAEIEFQHHDIARLFSIGTTTEGRDIWAIKISSNAAQDESKPAVLIVGGQHAREWITVEVPLHLARYLIDHYSSDPEVSRIVNNVEIWIVPMANPDGHEYSRVQDRLWRKNRRDNGDGSFGVDPNRNYDYMWGAGVGLVSSNPRADTYQGPTAFSEPESRALRDLVLSRHFRAIVDYHSYAQAIAYPSNSPQMHERAQIIAAFISAVHGRTYTASSYEPPLFSGGLVDWAYGVVHIDAYLIELRPDSAAHPSEHPWLLRQSAFELPETEIEPTWEEHRPALLFLLKAYGLLDQS